MQPADRRRLRPVKGRIAVTGFRVGELLEQPNLGSVSCEAGLNGVVGKGADRRARRRQRFAAGIQRI